MASSQHLTNSSPGRAKATFAFLLVFLACCATSVRAAIPIGVNQSFDTAPTNTQFSTRTWAGGSGTPNPIDAATLDAAVQTNSVSLITNALAGATGTPPAAGGAALWASQGGYLITRPTGVGYEAILATLVNSRSTNIPSVTIAYNLTTEAAVTEEVLGHLVYYSLSGAPNSWVQIPGISGDGTTGAKTAVIDLSATPLTPGSNLYILWADDNGSGSPDIANEIDNFGYDTGIYTPVITRQPVGTNVTIGGTFRLSVANTGLSPSYSWSKGGVPIDPTANPTAAQSTLVVTNAQFADAGSYTVSIANSAGGVVSSAANVTVSNDTTPPRFLRLTHTSGTPNIFRLIVNEPLCEGAACPNGADSLFGFNWLFEEVGGISYIITSIVSSGGTNYDFEISGLTFDSTKRYRLGPDPGGPSIIDLFGNAVSYSTFITNTPVFSFQQGVDGYTGVEDTELEQGTENGGPDAIHGNIVRILVDLDNAGGISHGLLKFNNIFGNGAGQIPLGSRIISATLVMNHTAANANGNLVNVHRMVAPWAQSVATWNSFVNGIQPDGVEALAAPDFSFDSVSQTVPFILNLDCTVSVQAWSDGFPNNGWALLPTGTDGYRFDSSILPTGPQLLVIFEQVPCTTAPSITRQPAPVTVTEGQTAIIEAGVSTCGNTTYQWQKGGVNVPAPAGTAGPSLVIPNAAPSDAGDYRIVVTNPIGTATSATAHLTVNPDTTRPVLLRATATSATTVTLLISKPVGVVGTYSFSPALSGVSAAFVNGANNGTVTVTSATRSLTTPYRLTITGLKDNRATPNTIDPNPTIVDLTGVSSVLAWANVGNWNYATNSQDANPNWKTGTFGPEWLVGEQFFGFEDSATLTNGLPIQPNPIRTPLQPNNNTNNPDGFVTTYFVRQVTLPALEANTAFAISFYIDDGAIFYVDGAEVGRYQMPTGPVTFTTRSTGGNGEAVLQTRLFSASAGTHTLAVEVHQAGTTTSDVVFGLEINKVTLPSKLAITQNQGTNIVSWSADNGWGLYSAQNVNGNYSAVAGNPVRSFRVPPAAQTNHTFYRLQYTP